MYQDTIAVHHSLMGGAPSEFKLTLYKDAGQVIQFQSNDLLEMHEYLMRTYVITEPVTLQFNTSDTYLLTQMLEFRSTGNDVNGNRYSIQNGNHKFTMKAAPGHTPVLDVQQLDNHVFWTNMSNIEIADITFANAWWNGGPAENGCNVRHFGTSNLSARASNITYRNCHFEKGYCAMRMTDALQDILIEDCRVDSLAYGSMRIGNGAVDHDILNLTLRRFKLLNERDQDVLYTASGHANPSDNGPQYTNDMFQVRNCDNLVIEDLEVVPNEFGRNRTQIMSVVGGTNVLINRIKAQNWGYLRNTTCIFIEFVDGITIQNCNLMPANDGVAKGMFYFRDTQNISLINNNLYGHHTSHGVFNTTRIRRFLKVVGNIFKFSPSSEMGFSWNTDSGYTPSLANDWQEEHHNIYVYDGTGVNVYANYSEVTQSNKKVTLTGDSSSVSLATWQSTYNRGQGNILIDNSTAEKLIFKDHQGYLANTSAGRNAIPSGQTTMTLDCYGATRTFPTDIGCFDADVIDRTSLGVPTKVAVPQINLIVNDTQNTFDWVDIVATLPRDYEYTTDGGITYKLAYVESTGESSRPINIGDINAAAGTIGVRQKGDYHFLPSVTTYNSTNYTQDAVTVDITFPTFTNTSGVWTLGDPPGTSYEDLVRTSLTQSLPAGQRGRIWQRYRAAGTSGNDGGANGILGLFTSEQSGVNISVPYGIHCLNYGVEAGRYVVNNNETEYQEERTYWGILRNTNGDLIFQWSSDGINWTTKATIGNYTGIIYPGLKFNKYGKVANPKLTIF